MKTTVEYIENNRKLRIATQNDIDSYITAFYSSDDEINYLTGSCSYYEESKVRTYYNNCLTDNSRYDFLIIDEDKIIGEAVLNEIDLDVKSASYRICVFYPSYLEKGFGTFATESILDFAFNHLNLQRVSLEVFSFNKRALSMYEKVGFVHEGRLRNAIKDKTGYGDILCMSMLLDEYISKNQ